MKTPAEILTLIANVSRKRDSLNVFLDILKSNIDRNLYIEHENNQYIALWQHVGQYYATDKRFYEAMKIFDCLYEELTLTQIENNIFIPKGMPLVWMRDYCLELNQPWLAQKYILLTIIEDAIANKGNINPDTTGAYFRAVWYQNIKDEQFKEISKKSYDLYKSNEIFGKFPEWILLNIDCDISTISPSETEINTFIINSPFV